VISSEERDRFSGSREEPGLADGGFVWDVD